MTFLYHCLVMQFTPDCCIGVILSYRMSGQRLRLPTTESVLQFPSLGFYKTSDLSRNHYRNNLRHTEHFILAKADSRTDVVSAGQCPNVTRVTIFIKRQTCWAGFSTVISLRVCVCLLAIILKIITS